MKVLQTKRKGSTETNIIDNVSNVSVECIGEWCHDNEDCSDLYDIEEIFG